jgi:hypothetical protein
MLPPFEKPVTYSRFESTGNSDSRARTMASMNATSSRSVRLSISAWRAGGKLAIWAAEQAP